MRQFVEIRAPDFPPLPGEVRRVRNEPWKLRRSRRKASWLSPAATGTRCLQPGDKVAFTLEGEKLVIAPTKAGQARLVKGRGGRKVLVAPADAPPMTTDAVKAIRADFP